ncbi:hypothetical protein B0A50_06113 [Salinomyces thailandicus]|uniref:Glycosyl transferase CAP10 domain-containing protein n=1 Tax=Salinomyces thailandicus TaxID=706561 RepID=A0A4V5N3Y4_9PEZI|nr:hypothetical protein B0A50_06113 [Salinomyces thailandica]
MRTIALYGTVAAFTTAALVFFGIHSGHGLATQTYECFHQDRPHHAAQHGGPSVSHGQSYGPPPRLPFAFDHNRDGRNYGLTEEQCTVAFPELYKEVDRAVEHRQKVGKVTQEELDVGWRGDGIVRARIHDNQLYVIDAHGVWDPNHRPRSVATLHALDRAISASQELLPDIEFTLTDHDSALDSPTNNHTTWSYSRLAHQESLWLMPDFGFWGWPNVGLRSYTELQALLEADEEDFLDKLPKLVWRGALAVGSGHDARVGLIKHSKGQIWSDVQTLDWSNKTDIHSKLLTMEDHCRYMFTAQTEGNTYSGRLKYLLNCNSILMSHRLDWIEHFHHLLRPTGPDQNYVKLKRDFSDLPKTMKSLLSPSKLEAAQRIVDNARETFRERYLTPAATACYWRALIRGWASVQDFVPEIWEFKEVEDGVGGKKMRKGLRGVPFESYAIMEQVEWQLPAKPRKVCIDHSGD